MDESVANDIRQYISQLNKVLKSKSEMHFVAYTQDTNFEKYFKALHYVLSQPIKINIMIVNKSDAEKLTTAMDIEMKELRELFYVKIPERLFYGLTRDLPVGQHIEITIDENSEYEKIELEKKIIEQMNAHSAYRKKAYKVVKVEQESSEKDTLLQMIDNLIGMIVFILEKQYKEFEGNRDNITLDVKCDLIYRLLIEQNNLDLLHRKVALFRWEDHAETINQIELSRFTGDFIMSKTKYDVSEMAKLAQIRAIHPNETTKFYRAQMGYPRQLRKLLGYMDELDAKGRNSYYTES